MILVGNLLYFSDCSSSRIIQTILTCGPSKLYRSLSNRISRINNLRQNHSSLSPYKKKAITHLAAACQQRHPGSSARGSVQPSAYHCHHHRHRHRHHSVLPPSQSSTNPRKITASSRELIVPGATKPASFELCASLLLPSSRDDRPPITRPMRRPLCSTSGAYLLPEQPHRHHLVPLYISVDL